MQLFSYLGLIQLNFFGEIIAILALLLLGSLISSLAYAQEFLPITKWGKYGTANGSFNQPYGLAADSAGNLYVADTGNNRIQKFSSNGTFVTGWGKIGLANGSFNQPQGVAIIPQRDGVSDNILVSESENNRIQVFSSNGTFITKLGRHGVDDGHFKSPTQITLSSLQSNNVLVSDTGNNRIQVFSHDR
jgi:tripartite motif-containing protein 71